MAKRQSFGRYEPEEVLALVEGYEELRTAHRCQHVSPAALLVRLIDLRRGLASLGRPERIAVLLCGQMGMTTRQAAAIANTSKSRVARDYRRGLETLISYLNGEV